MKEYNFCYMAPYRLSLIFLSPLIVLYTVYRALKDGGLIYLKQRFGFSQPQLTSSLWFHCASVGEVNTAIDLIRLFIDNYPEKPIIVSTNTPTGKEILLKHKLRNTIHCYLPLDYGFSVNRTIKNIKPDGLLIIETEIWPRLFQLCTEANIRIILYNARLTKKTLYSSAWLRRLYKKSLNSVTAILAKSEQEEKHFLKLGANTKIVSVSGSLKFSVQADSVKNIKPNIPTPYWLAASTHNDEELRICKAWQRCGRNELLVIIPRYPERRHSIQSEIIELGLSLQLMSSNPIPKEGIQVFVVDKFGEMEKFIAAASVVFVGGSLIKRGGQNIIEPAKMGAVVVVGSDISNFSAEFDALKSRDAIIQINDENELVDTVTSFLDNPEKAQIVGAAAQQLCLERSTVAVDYYHQIVPLLYPSNK